MMDRTIIIIDTWTNVGILSDSVYVQPPHVQSKLHWVWTSMMDVRLFRTIATSIHNNVYDTTIYSILMKFHWRIHHLWCSHGFSWDATWKFLNLHIKSINQHVGLRVMAFASFEPGDSHDANPCFLNKLDEITYPFPNFNGCTVEVPILINNFTPHLIMDVIINSS